MYKYVYGITAIILVALSLMVVEYVHASPINKLEAQINVFRNEVAGLPFIGRSKAVDELTTKINANKGTTPEFVVGFLQDRGVYPTFIYLLTLDRAKAKELKIEYFAGFSVAPQFLKALTDKNVTKFGLSQNKTHVTLIFIHEGLPPENHL